MEASQKKRQGKSKRNRGDAATFFDAFAIKAVGSKSGRTGPSEGS